MLIFIMAKAVSKVYFRIIDNKLIISRGLANALLFIQGCIIRLR